MPYYNVFCMFCSVRLGAIAVGTISFIEVAIVSILIGVGGPNWFSLAAKTIEGYIKDNGVDDRFLTDIRQMDKNKDTYFIVVTTLHVSYLVACVLDVIGAFIINKWMLLPFIILEIIRLAIYLTLFCMTLIVIKKAINLGVLIGYSILGTFTILFLGYLWACVVSLFQIISIVNSSSYQSLYGDNPLKALPKINQSGKPNKPNKVARIQRVKFFPSPNFNKNADKLKPSPKNDTHPFEIGQSRRSKNDYIEMKRNYLNHSDFGYGRTNTHS